MPGVALLLSGNVRDLLSTGPAIREMIVGPLSADVFIHTWSTVDHSSATWWKSSLSSECNEQNVPQVDENALQELFVPRRVIVEPAKEFAMEQSSAEVTQPHPWFSGVTSMWYGIGTAWELMEMQEAANQYKYEHVVRWRFDLLPSRPLSGLDLTDQLLLAHSDRYSAFSIPSDVAAIGPRSKMETYAAVYRRLPGLFEEHETASPLADFVPESLLALHLRQHHVDWDEIRIGLKLHRPSGETLVVATEEPWIRATHFDRAYIDAQLRPELERCAVEYVVRNLQTAGCSNAREVAELLTSDARLISWADIRGAGSTMNAAKAVLNTQTEPGPSIGDAIYWQWWVETYAASLPLQRLMLIVGAGPWVPVQRKAFQWVKRKFRGARRRGRAALRKEEK